MNVRVKKCIEAILHLPFFFKRRENKRRIILALAPDYLNYGDHAIALAERDFFKEYFPKHEVIELPLAFYQHYKEKCHSLIRPDDIIVITGGGYLGSVWPEHHVFVEEFINWHPQNKIVIFPNTVFWEREDYLKAQAFAELIKQHGNTIVCVREENSFQVMRKFGIEAVLVPDFVLMNLIKHGKKIRKDTIALCLRDDRERVISQNTIENVLRKTLQGYQIKRITMAVEHVEIPAWIRALLVKYKLKEFSTAGLVITDRLHGMIFSVITGTPCIVMDNASHKVSGVYKWIAELKYVCLIEQPNQIPELIEQLKGYDDETLDAMYVRFFEENRNKYLKQIAHVMRSGDENGKD